MRFLTRTLSFVIAILLAFWFTAENANELVWIDLVFFRIRASLQLILFSSVLGGMAISTLVAWRAERREKRRFSAALDPIELGSVAKNLETDHDA